MEAVEYVLLLTFEIIEQDSLPPVRHLEHHFVFSAKKKKEKFFLIQLTKSKVPFPHPIQMLPLGRFFGHLARIRDNLIVAV